MHTLTIEAWTSDCINRFIALYPSSPLDGTDWDDVACDLWAEDSTRTPAEAVTAFDVVYGRLEWRAVSA